MKFPGRNRRGRRDGDRGKPDQARANPLSRVVPDAYEEAAARSLTRTGGQVLARVALIAGPLLAVGLFMVSARSAGPAAQQGHDADNGGDPAGWAQMYVRSWLSADRDSSAGIEKFYPAGIRSQRQAGTQVPIETAAVSTSSAGRGAWSVVVAAHIMTEQKDGKHTMRLQCQKVTLIEQPSRTRAGGAAYVAAALPSPVACPSTLADPALDYPHNAAPDGALGKAVLGYLTAYLTGGGDLARYTSQDSGIKAVEPVPYAAVHLDELSTHEEFEAGQEDRPLDDVRVRVLARAWGYDATGETQPLDYALTLVANAGSWEVLSIDPSPLLLPDKPTPAPSETAPGPTPSTSPSGPSGAAGQPPSTTTPR